MIEFSGGQSLKEVLTTKSILDTLQEILDEERKAQSIKKLEKAIEGMDADLVEGLDDVESAIEDYRSCERAGMSNEEYTDEKANLFDQIVSAVEDVELNEEVQDFLDGNKKLIEEIKYNESKIEAPKAHVDTKQIWHKEYSYTTSSGKVVTVKGHWENIKK